MGKDKKELMTKDNNFKVLNVVSYTLLGILFLSTTILGINGINNSKSIDSLNSVITNANQNNSSLNSQLDSLQSSFEQQQSQYSASISSLNEELENANQNNSSLNSQISSMETTSNTFTVTYISNNEIVHTENVFKGNNVVAVPSVPTIKGYDVAWSSDGKNIQSDTIITAVATPKTYNISFYTGILEKHEMNLSAKGDLFDVYEYTNNGFLSYNYYIAFNLNTYSFTHEEEEFHFNSDFSKVLKSDDDQIATVSEGSFWIRNTYFTINNEHTRLSISLSTSCDNKGLFKIDEKFYKIDFEQLRITNITDNTSASTEFTLSDTSGYLRYNPVTKKASFYDNPTQYAVTNNSFTKDSVTYEFDIDSYCYYMKGEDQTEYKSGYSAPLKTTYTYGEDLSFSYTDFNLKLIKTEGFDITEQSDSQLDDMGWRKVASVDVMFLEEKAYVGKIDDGIHIYNPIGDLVVYVTYSPSSI